MKKLLSILSFVTYFCISVQSSSAQAIKFSKSFGDSKNFEYTFSSIELPSGGYMVFGSKRKTYSARPDHMIIAKIKINGDTVYRKFIPQLFSSFENPEVLKTGEIKTTGFGSDSGIIRMVFDTNSKVPHFTYFKNPLDTFHSINNNSILHIPGAGYFMGGRHKYANCFLLHTDENFQVQWYKSYDSTELLASPAISSNNGKICLLGYLKDSTGIGSHAGGLIIDTNGIIISKKSFYQWYYKDNLIPVGTDKYFLTIANKNFIHPTYFAVLLNDKLDTIWSRSTHDLVDTIANPLLARSIPVFSSELLTGQIAILLSVQRNNGIIRHSCMILSPQGKREALLVLDSLNSIYESRITYNYCRPTSDSGLLLSGDNLKYPDYALGLLTKIKFPFTRTGISQNQDSKINRLQIFPVPAIEVVNVSLPENSGKLSYDIYTLDGKICQRGSILPGLAQFQIQRKDLLPGIYFLKIRGEAAIQYSGIIIFN